MNDGYWRFFCHKGQNCFAYRNYFPVYYSACHTVMCGCLLPIFIEAGLSANGAKDVIAAHTSLVLVKFPDCYTFVPSQLTFNIENNCIWLDCLNQLDKWLWIIDCVLQINDLFRFVTLTARIVAIVVRNSSDEHRRRGKTFLETFWKIR